MKAITLSTEYISRHPYFKARVDSYQLPSGKVVDPYFFVEIPVSATAMALTKEGEVIFVSQYRHPIGETILELPGGFIDEGEDKLDAIKRELQEETGYTFDDVQFLGTTAGNPGILNNYTHLFLARGGVKTSTQQLDHNEEIEVELKSLEEARDILMKSEIKQSMHALCMFYAFQILDGDR